MGIFEKLFFWLKKESTLISRVPCPCCGYPTLSGRGQYEICDLCNWEDDGQDNSNANEVVGGPNGTYSLAEARENFKRFRIMYHPDKPSTSIGGNANSKVEEQAKLEIMKAFDSHQGNEEIELSSPTWKNIEANKETLKNELLRRIKEYEGGSNDDEPSQGSLEKDKGK